MYLRNILILVAIFLIILLSVSGCAREQQATEPTGVPSSPPITEPSTAPSSKPSIGGGGPASTVVPSDPQKSFEDAVLNADLIVTGTITDKRYELVPYDTKPISNTGNITQQEYNLNTGNMTQGKIYTIFTLTVEKVIKGDPATKQVFVKVQGGIIEGKLIELATGEYFSISDQVLLTLHREDDDVLTLSSPGLVWIRGSKVMSEPELSEIIGRVIRIMKANNIPIALPESEWPPLIGPAAPAQRPEKKKDITPTVKL